ncbi:peptidoglycan DD-metalloendopeptidase family protein [bacterium]|nr:peptidoglycan DD-metalloendopeptidase family protein [bacterium]
MKKKLLNLGVFLLSVFQLFAQDHSPAFVPITHGGEYIVSKSQCVLPDQRRFIVERLKENTKRLKQEGILSSSRTSMVTLFDWPLQQAVGFNYNSYYGISNYIDQDLTYPNNLLDYNCGTRTYDLASGYNHRGTDIFLWPFSWHMVNNDQVEVIAAATGTIILKDDGNTDMNCDFSNPDWNAVYIEHADGSVAWYGHMKNGSLTSKTVGQMVTQGEYLGVVASSGSSTGPHLHFEVWTDNTYTTLVDPWDGGCNSMNGGTSWWNSQKPYRESTLNHLMTNNAPVVFNTCPTPATINEKDTFVQGSSIYFTTFYHDQQQNQVTDIRILQPNGTPWSTWSHTSPATYTSSWWYWWLNFPGTEPIGTWTFEVTYEGNVFTHDFQIESVLPVELVSFTGKKEEDEVALHWETASEAGNDYFEVQRSENGHHFETIGKVTGSGDSQSFNAYGFQDHKPIVGINYYRLNQVDYNDKQEFSKVIAVEFNQNSLDGKLEIYPNPTMGNIINITFDELPKEMSILNVYDQLGRRVVSDFPLYGTEEQVNLKNLSNGIYIFEVAVDNQVLYRKVLIQ